MQYLKQRIESKEAYRPEGDPTAGSAGSGFATGADEVAELERRISAIKAREPVAAAGEDDEAPTPVVRKKVRKKRKKKRTRRVNRPRPVVPAGEPSGEAQA